MQVLVLSIALLLTGGSAAAMPYAESYVEYREKMLLKGWESVKCSETIHTYPLPRLIQRGVR